MQRHGLAADAPLPDERTELIRLLRQRYADLGDTLARKAADALEGFVPKRDEKLRQVSLATMDAKLLGCGFVMILPDNSFQHVPLDRIEIKPEKGAQETKPDGPYEMALKGRRREPNR